MDNETYVVVKSWAVLGGYVLRYHGLRGDLRAERRMIDGQSGDLAIGTFEPLPLGRRTRVCNLPQEVKQMVVQDLAQMGVNDMVPG